MVSSRRWRHRWPQSNPGFTIPQGSRATRKEGCRRPQLRRWREPSAPPQAALQPNWLPAPVPRMHAPHPGASRRGAFLPRPVNRPSRSRAGRERVKSASVTPPAGGRGGRWAEGWWWRERPSRERAGQTTPRCLEPRPDSHDCISRSVRRPRFRLSLDFARGKSQGPTHRENDRSLQAAAPPSFPEPSVPRFPTTGAQATQSALAISSSPLPLQGRCSRPLRGGVGIKELRSPEGVKARRDLR